MKKTFLEQYEASERLTEFFKPLLPLEPRTIESNKEVCYGKLDPINIDQIPVLIRKIDSGDRPSDKKKRAYLDDILTSVDAEHLKNLHRKIVPKAMQGRTSHRLLSYLINSRLTELGISPRWREIKKPSK